MFDFYSRGTDVSIENLHQGFTHVFESTFESVEGIAEYLAHPDHVDFANILLPALEKVLIIDYKPTAVWWRQCFFIEDLLYSRITFCCILQILNLVSLNLCWVAVRCRFHLKKRLETLLALVERTRINFFVFPLVVIIWFLGILFSLLNL